MVSPKSHSLAPASADLVDAQPNSRDHQRRHSMPQMHDADRDAMTNTRTALSDSCLEPSASPSSKAIGLSRSAEAFSLEPTSGTFEPIACYYDTADPREWSLNRHRDATTRSCTTPTLNAMPPDAHRSLSESRCSNSRVLSIVSGRPHSPRASSQSTRFGGHSTGFKPNWSINTSAVSFEAEGAPHAVNSHHADVPTPGCLAGAYEFLRHGDGSHPIPNADTSTAANQSSPLHVANSSANFGRSLFGGSPIHVPAAIASRTTYGERRRGSVVVLEPAEVSVSCPLIGILYDVESTGSAPRALADRSTSGSVSALWMGHASRSSGLRSQAADGPLGDALTQGVGETNRSKPFAFLRGTDRDSHGVLASAPSLPSWQTISGPSSKQVMNASLSSAARSTATMMRVYRSLLPSELYDDPDKPCFIARTRPKHLTERSSSLRRHRVRIVEKCDSDTLTSSECDDADEAPFDIMPDSDGEFSSNSSESLPSLTTLTEASGRPSAGTVTSESAQSPAFVLDSGAGGKVTDASTVIPSGHNPPSTGPQLELPLEKEQPQPRPSLHSTRNTDNSVATTQLPDRAMCTVEPECGTSSAAPRLWIPQPPKVFATSCGASMHRHSFSEASQEHTPTPVPSTTPAAATTAADATSHAPVLPRRGSPPPTVTATEVRRASVRGFANLLSVPSHLFCRSRRQSSDSSSVSNRALGVHATHQTQPYTMSASPSHTSSLPRLSRTSSHTHRDGKVTFSVTSTYHCHGTTSERARTFGHSPSPASHDTARRLETSQSRSVPLLCPQVVVPIHGETDTVLYSVNTAGGASLSPLLPATTPPSATVSPATNHAAHGLKSF